MPLSQELVQHQQLIKVGHKKSRESTMTGLDLSSQLKRFEPPTFKGEVKLYDQWKQDYLRIVIPIVGEDLYYLRNCLVGEPFEDIKYLQTFEKAICRLDEKYGDERKLIIILNYEIENFGLINEGDYGKLISFITLLESAWNIVKARGLDSQFDNLMFIGKVERIFPDQFRMKWYQSCEGKKEDKFDRLMKYLTNQRSIHESLVFFKQIESGLYKSGKKSYETSFNEISNYTGSGLEPLVGKSDELTEKVADVKLASTLSKVKCKPIRCPLHKCEGHSLETCNIFLRLNSKARLAVAKKYNLCFKCLIDHHPAHLCGRKELCPKMIGKDICTGNHHFLLHGYFVGNSREGYKSRPEDSQGNENGNLDTGERFSETHEHKATKDVKFEENHRSTEVMNKSSDIVNRVESYKADDKTDVGTMESKKENEFGLAEFSRFLLMFMMYILSQNLNGSLRSWALSVQSEFWRNLIYMKEAAISIEIWNAKYLLLLVLIIMNCRKQIKMMQSRIWTNFNYGKESVSEKFEDKSLELNKFFQHYYWIGLPGICLMCLV